MSTSIEVFADITCPFTHVGLSLVAERLAEVASPLKCHLRAWPLEWVNGTPLEADAVAVKATALRRSLGIKQFSGINPTTWPTTTIPALNLEAAARQIDPSTGFTVGLALRSALFEDGADISDAVVLGKIAKLHGLPSPMVEPSQALLDDYEEGLTRGVEGSPHFFAGDDEFFCPSLEIGHDERGDLTARFDVAGLDALISNAIGDSTT